jgi:hypothetical protein
MVTNVAVKKGRVEPTIFTFRLSNPAKVINPNNSPRPIIAI